MQPSTPFYAQTDPIGECPHARTSATCDVAVAGHVGPWYVACLDCGREGPRAETPELAVQALTDAAFLDDLQAIGDAVGALVLWRLAAAGDPEAFALVQHALGDPAALVRDQWDAIPPLTLAGPIYEPADGGPLFDVDAWPEVQRATHWPPHEVKP